MTTLTHKNMTLLSVLTSIIALLLVALVVWVHLSTQEQVQQLQLQVKNMQQSLNHADSLALRKLSPKPFNNTIQAAKMLK